MACRVQVIWEGCQRCTPHLLRDKKCRKEKGEVRAVQQANPLTHPAWLMGGTEEQKLQAGVPVMPMLNTVPV
jgi:hypothetical protein